MSIRTKLQNAGFRPRTLNYKLQQQENNKELSIIKQWLENNSFGLPKNMISTRQTHSR